MPPRNSGGDSTGGDRQLIHAEHGQIDGKLLDFTATKSGGTAGQRRAFLTLMPAKATRRAKSAPPSSAGDAASSATGHQACGWISMPIPCLTPLAYLNKWPGR